MGKQSLPEHTSQMPTRIGVIGINVSLPDGRWGTAVEYGTLDKDGLFYPCDEQSGNWVKVLGVEGAKIIYCPKSRIVQTGTVMVNR